MKNETQIITDVIKSVEDAITATGRMSMPDFSCVPEDMREYFEAHYNMAVIAEALNEEWEADWNNSDQRKYYPWFYNDSSSSGFAFGLTYCNSSIAHAGYASRLCFKTSALAEYAGREFIEIWNIILMK